MFGSRLYRPALLFSATEGTFKLAAPFRLFQKNGNFLLPSAAPWYTYSLPALYLCKTQYIKAQHRSPVGHTRGRRSASCARPCPRPRCTRPPVWSRRRRSNGAWGSPRGACRSRAGRPARSISGRRAAACRRSRRSRPDARGPRGPPGPPPPPSRRPRSAWRTRDTPPRGACRAGSRGPVRGPRASAGPRTPSAPASPPRIGRCSTSPRCRAAVAAAAAASPSPARPRCPRTGSCLPVARWSTGVPATAVRNARWIVIKSDRAEPTCPAYCSREHASPWRRARFPSMSRARTRRCHSPQRSLASLVAFGRAGARLIGIGDLADRRPFEMQPRVWEIEWRGVMRTGFDEGYLADGGSDNGMGGCWWVWVL